MGREMNAEEVVDNWLDVESDVVMLKVRMKERRAMIKRMMRAGRAGEMYQVWE